MGRSSSNDNEPAARGREVNCNLHHGQSWVSRVTAVTSAAPLALCARPTARRGRSRRVVRPPQPVSAPSVSTSSVPVAATASSVACASNPATSPGEARVSPASAVSSVSPTTRPTTSWSVPTPSPSPPLFRSMPPHSGSGTRTTTQGVGRRSQRAAGEKDEEVKKSKSVEAKQADRFKKQGKVEPAIERQFEASRLYAVIASRPGQSGRCDGYILEGEELAFYQRAIRK